jgi:hypothetical protein
LRLHGDAGRPGCIDQPAAVTDNRSGGGPRGRKVARIDLPLPGQLRRVGVETEADLAAALLYERRQPIRKGAQEVSRP